MGFFTRIGEGSGRMVEALRLVEDNKKLKYYMFGAALVPLGLPLLLGAMCNMLSLPPVISGVISVLLPTVLVLPVLALTTAWLVKDAYEGSALKILKRLDDSLARLYSFPWFIYFTLAFWILTSLVSFLPVVLLRVSTYLNRPVLLAIPAILVSLFAFSTMYMWSLLTEQRFAIPALALRTVRLGLRFFIELVGCFLRFLLELLMRLFLLLLIVPIFAALIYFASQTSTYATILVGIAYLGMTLVLMFGFMPVFFSVLIAPYLLYYRAQQDR